MTKRLIVVSPQGQRLTLRLDQQSLEPSAAEGDEVTHVIVEPGKGAAPAPQPSPPWTPSDPPPDITMNFRLSLVGGRLQGLDAAALNEADRVSGPLTFADIAGRLARMPDGGTAVVILDSGHG